ncbi:hypothetical protein UW636_07435, partial [Streptococcus agalactiae]
FTLFSSLLLKTAKPLTRYSKSGFPSSVILNLVLLFQGFLTQNPIIYLLFFITLVCAFYFAYKFITYTPTIVKNALQYIKKLKNV